MHEEKVFDPATDTHAGCVPGISLCSYRDQSGADKFFAVPGDDVTIMFPSAGKIPEPRSAKLTITDFYESKMNEYDSSFVFLPLAEMQKLRGLVDPVTKVANFNSIQIRLKPGVEPAIVRDLLRNAFPEQFYVVSTWRDKQGAIAGGRADGDGGAERAAVPDHRGGRLRHPGDLLHDRRREDPRHRHPQEPRRRGRG